ncbi:hypothetical protein J6590_084668 [Homalodisca vitripennis]|nr:hypothetical protein J6590_084668 [Homalodisca vitripennis]
MNYRRHQRLRIFGVEENTGEDTDYVVDLCADKLGVNLLASAIFRSHRVGGLPKPDPDGYGPHGAGRLGLATAGNAEENPQLEEVESTRFLGIYIDRGLTWTDHVEHVCARVASGVFALRNL